MAEASKDPIDEILVQACMQAIMNGHKNGLDDIVSKAKKAISTHYVAKGEAGLEQLIDAAGEDVRLLVRHTSGRWTVKTGKRALHPSKLYEAPTLEAALSKMLKEQQDATV